MSSDEDKALSKYLSYVLRHAPDAGGIQLEPGGWVQIDRLLAGAASQGNPIERADFFNIVASSDKKRFTLSDDQTRVRAAQGHSIDVDLGLVPMKPPETLWHGTAETSVAAIQREGLLPGSRQHVHLSSDPDTARKVGMRHGKPVILTIQAGRAHQDGHAFWQADNGVWLTDPLPAQYLSMPEGST